MSYRPYRKFAELPANGKQITVIKMAQRQLQIDDDTYRDMLEERFKVRSSTKLTFVQATEFIKELEGKGFTLLPGKNQQVKPAPRSRPPISRKDGKLVGLATRGELEKVVQVAALIEWRSATGLEAFLETRMKIKGGKVRTSADAYLAVEGLKKMFENGMKKAHGAAWWTGEYSEPIMEYIRIHKPAEWR